VRIIISLLTVTIIASASCNTRPDPRAAAAVPPPLVPRDTPLSVTAAGDIALTADTTISSARVAAGATLASILRAHDVIASDVAELVQRAGSVFDLRKVRAAQPYRLETTPQRTIRALDYEIDGDRLLRVVRSATNTLVATVLSIPKTRSVDIVRGRIDRARPSLVAALGAEGETIELTLALADIFGGEIDFTSGVQPGDEFQLAVEKQYREDKQFAGYGKILAAVFSNAGRRVRAVRFTPDGGSPDYYDERGVSLRRFFLASPLKFQPVITSGFSRSRLHPVLERYRAHLGVDYRAPAGAPVVAVADGVVVSAGASGAAGRMVHLRHADGYETEYLHLSSVAVRAGARIHQGELIGRVGATGLATAPHLDYRLKRNGTFINPVAAHRSMPPADPIPALQMLAFEAARDRALAQLSTSAVDRVANRNAIVQ